jgi:hypothetical protein
LHDFPERKIQAKAGTQKKRRAVPRNDLVSRARCSTPLFAA